MQFVTDSWELHIDPRAQALARLGKTYEVRSQAAEAARSSKSYPLLFRTCITISRPSQTCHRVNSKPRTHRYDVFKILDPIGIVSIGFRVCGVGV